MNTKAGIAVLVLLVLGLLASFRRDSRPAVGRHVVIHLNDFGQITRVENNSGMSLDMSGLKIKTK